MVPFDQGHQVLSEKLGLIVAQTPMQTGKYSLSPREKPFIKYIYSPKMDIDELVYNIGGILGLWFGLSIYHILILKNKNILSGLKKLFQQLESSFNCN